MNERQRTALVHHCRLAVETINERFAAEGIMHSAILTVDSGYG